MASATFLPTSEIEHGVQSAMDANERRNLPNGEQSTVHAKDVNLREITLGETRGSQHLA